ncbi:Yip1 family protein [Bdellovibrio sp. HCB337]|uniref:Yip1 family protein n=1 Tax=Bdellovibrio sp. HCB337 TaxID=3394358 RepID=UPI0039A62238
MRDVSEASALGPHIKNVAKSILQFLKHPIQEIARLPDWSWKTLVWVQVSCAMASGVLAGLTKPGFFSILAGIILTPIVSMVMVSVLTAFLYYYFQVFEKRSASARKLFTLSVFASIPFFILQIGSSLLPPITLIGFAFAAMLMTVGLTENFQMEKRRAIRLCVVLFSIVMLVWAANKVSLSRLDRAAQQQAIPASN